MLLLRFYCLWYNLSVIIIYITCPNRTEAKRIGRVLVEKRLAGCVNIFPVEVIYWWQKKITEEKEVVLIVKTFAKNFTKIEKLVKKLHSYEIPCILAIPIEKVSKSYFNWLKKEIL